MTGYKNLEAWKKAMVLVKEVYALVKLYPTNEMYGLSSQSKRAAVSIPSNIAEGVGRNYKKDTIQFLHIARGSAYELETLMNIAVMVEIITEEKYLIINTQIDECAKILNGLISYYEKADLK
jgi:four helix bundle protein